MVQGFVNVGAVANDGTGDKLRTGGQTINANFTDLYRSRYAAMAFDFVPAPEHADIVAGTSDYDASADLNDWAQSAPCLAMNPGTYLIADSVRPVSDTTIYGNGATLKCPDAGFTLVPQTRYGLLNFFDVDNVDVWGLHLYGTKSAAIGQTPKIIYAENATKISIRGGSFRRSAFEGFWTGGALTATADILIDGVYVEDVGHPAGGFVGLPAIQGNCTRLVVSNCRLKDVGSGIALTGQYSIATGNVIENPTISGIGDGDGASGPGNVITGNTIKVYSHDTDSRFGIILNQGGAPKQTCVVGNSIHIAGMAGHNVPIGIASYNNDVVNIEHNEVLITGSGYAAVVRSDVSDMTAFIQDLFVRYLSPSPGQAAIVGRAADGRAATFLVRNCVVTGIGSDDGSFAYDFQALGTGALTAKIKDIIKTSGRIRVGGTLIAADAQNNDFISPVQT